MRSLKVHLELLVEALEPLHPPQQNPDETLHVDKLVYAALSAPPLSEFVTSRRSNEQDQMRQVDAKRAKKVCFDAKAQWSLSSRAVVIG